MLIGLGLLLQAEPSQAAQPQTAPPTAPAAQPAAPAPGKTVHLAAGTLFEVEMVDPLSSNTSHVGDKFALRLAAPVSVDGADVVAAGAMGEGEVIDASHNGMAGTAGKLILACRRLDLNGQSVRIRGMALTTAKSRTGAATAVLIVPYVGVIAPFISGGEVRIPAGTHYTVKLAEDADIPVNPSKDTDGK